MRAFLYDRDGKSTIYTGFSNDSGDHEGQIRSLKTSSRMPLYTKLIVSDKLKRRVYCKEPEGWGKECIFVRESNGWKEEDCAD